MINKLFTDELKNFTSCLDTFVNLYINKKLPQTLLLTGEKGIGKLNFVYHFVNYVFSQNDEKHYNFKCYKTNKDSKIYNLLSQNSHPNCLLISPLENKKYIDITQTQKIHEYLNKSSFDKIPKIIIINGSEYLNISSSNCLLKTLESKYENVYFFLIQNSKKNILQTIKSRCIEFKFFLRENERLNRINEILKMQYNDLNSDFKNKYLSPIFFQDLLKYCEDNNLEIKKININKLLINIFSKQNYKKNEFLHEHFLLIIQLFFYKLIINNKNTEKYFSSLKYFTTRFDEVNKYNLDFESYLIEFKHVVFNEK